MKLLTDARQSTSLQLAGDTDEDVVILGLTLGRPGEGNKLVFF